MNERAWRAAAPCAVLLLFSMDVDAQRPPEVEITGVTLELPRCPELPYDDAQLREHLQLELSMRGFRPLEQVATGTPGGLLGVELELPECTTGSRELTLRVLDADRRRVLQRTLPLSEIPSEARPRTLALAIAEALDRSRPSSAPAPVDAPAPRRPPVPAPVPSPSAGLAPSKASSLQLGVAAQRRSPLLDSHPFWGAELSVSRSTPWDTLSWIAEAAFATNTTDTRLGQMQTDWWSIGLGLDLRERGLLELAVGPRLALAYVSARPELASAAPDPATDALMVLWGAGAELALPLAGSWLLRGTLALEQPFRGLVLTAGGERTLSLEGWLLTSGLGFAFCP